MPIPAEAFRHHPELADRIRDPELSVFRNFDYDEIDRRMADQGLPSTWRRSHEEREATRLAALGGHPGTGPLWVFAYGSLMWDPAIDFDEVRVATLSGYHRSLCLVDRRGARGSAEAPGVMAALDTGGSCQGLAFRIPAPLVARETERLWRREMIATAYIPVFAPASTAQGPITALAFAADPAGEGIEIDLPHADRVRYIATGTGVLGSSREYLENTIGQFALLGIRDPELEHLLAETNAYCAAG